VAFGRDRDHPCIVAWAPNSHSPFKFTQRERLRIGRG